MEGLLLERLICSCGDDGWRKEGRMFSIMKEWRDNEIKMYIRREENSEMFWERALSIVQCICRHEATTPEYFL